MLVLRRMLRFVYISVQFESLTFCRPMTTMVEKMIAPVSKVVENSEDGDEDNVIGVKTYYFSA
jgi:hypothetical protein